MASLKCIKVLLLIAFACCYENASSAKSKDLITSLPGLKELPKHKMYSGYLDVLATRHFHYWFVTSQNKPETDPVVLWLNGGPGCSSLDGFLSENGPFHLRNDGETLYSNPYSWNKIANVLYLESPAGVGFSYDDNGDVTTDDIEVSHDNYKALVDFFKKFPEFSSNSFFIFGESYGGVYAPTLSVQVMQGKFKINFQGMGIGNGVTDLAMNVNSVFFFAYYHGIIGHQTWKEITSYCCIGAAVKENCNFATKENSICKKMVQNLLTKWYTMGLNRYAIYRDCYTGSPVALEQYHRAMKFLFSIDANTTNPLKIQQRQDMKATRSASNDHGLPCINSTAETSWLNRQDVRSALHVAPNLPEWGVCSDSVKYTANFETMAPQYHELLQAKNFRILVYNGDVDIVCNFLGDDWFVQSLGLGRPTEQQPWYVDGQIAGFAKYYGAVTFTTIRGSGHMVPQWAPSYSYSMFQSFLNNRPFSPK